MAHTHNIRDSDKHFIIDPAKRAIINKSEKTTLMQGDHNSERISFEIPREIDGHDMSLCNSVRVEFLNIDSATRAKNPGKYDVDDFQISPDNSNIMVGTWLIKKNATKYAGSLAFLISFACISDSGVIEYSWSTYRYNGVQVLPKISGIDESGVDAETKLAEFEAMIDESGVISGAVADKFSAVIECAKTHKWLQEFMVDNATEDYPTFAYNERTIRYAPLVDLSKKESLWKTFCNCQSLITMPTYDCSSMTNAQQFCYMCISLLEFPKMKGFCKGSKNTTLRQTFYSCYNLRSIGELDCTNVTNTSNAFYKCEALEKIDIAGVLQNTSYSFSYSTKLTTESAKGIIRALANYAGTDKAYKYSITFPSEVWERLNAEGNTAPNGNTWANYVEAMGWNV